MQSQSFASRYLSMKRDKMAHGWALAKRNKGCYLFLAPYAILFITFFILPVCTSIFYSFTYYNILEPPRFNGVQNYINLILQDDIFLTAIKNTFVCAVIIGPVGYILSFLFAWFINELPKWLRAIAVIIFYVPSIGGAAFEVFLIIFRGDAYGWFNSILMDQKAQTRGFPEIAGGYSTTRHITNSVRKVINTKEDQRETLLNYARTINEEIRIKRQEFNLPVD